MAYMLGSCSLRGSCVGRLFVWLVCWEVVCVARVLGSCCGLCGLCVGRLCLCGLCVGRLWSAWLASVWLMCWEVVVCMIHVLGGHVCVAHMLGGCLRGLCVGKLWSVWLVLGSCGLRGLCVAFSWHQPVGQSWRLSPHLEGCLCSASQLF